MRLRFSLDLTKSYRPLDMVAYLRTHNWIQAKREGDRYSIWTKQSPNREEFEILVPIDLEAPDLTTRVKELLDTLQVEEKRPLEDVWEDLSSPNCDIVRLRLLANEGGMTLPLEEGAAAFQFSRDLLLSAGCAAWKPRSVYGPRKPEQALEWVRGARLGQTRPGSYVIKIIAPLTEMARSNRLFDGEEVSPSRQAMLMLSSGLLAALDGIRDTAVTGRIESIQSKVIEGVSANFCDALAGLGRIGRGVQFQFSWAASERIASNIPTKIDVPADAVSYLQEASRWFRKSATIEEVDFFGSVRKLEKSNDDEDIVTLVGVIDSQPRTVRCKVDGENRRQITRAHHDRSAIVCTGELVKEGKSYHLKNPRNLEIHEDSEV